MPFGLLLVVVVLFLVKLMEVDERLFGHRVDQIGLKILSFGVHAHWLGLFEVGNIVVLPQHLQIIIVIMQRFLIRRHPLTILHPYLLEPFPIRLPKLFPGREQRFRLHTEDPLDPLLRAPLHLGAPLG
jgi:hypothetical protein